MPAVVVEAVVDVAVVGAAAVLTQSSTVNHEKWNLQQSSSLLNS